MIRLADLPAINATLNATSAVFLVAGYIMIRQRRIAAHAVCMVVALAVSVVFLVSYLTYHIQVGTIHFKGQGWIGPCISPSSLLMSHWRWRLPWCSPP